MNNVWDIFNDFTENSNENNFEDLNKHENEVNDIKNSQCEFCEKESLIIENSILICSECGLLQTRRLNNDVEYRFYGESDNKTSNPERLGMATNFLLPQSSLGSVIGSRNYEKHYIKRMIRYDSWNKMPYHERSQYIVFNRVSNICKQYSIPSIIIEQSKNYYKIISEISISRGANRNGLIAACVYMACRNESVPRTSKEIADIFKISLHDMTTGCKKFKELLRLTDNDKILKNNTSNAIDYIDRFCSNINLTIDIKNMSEFVAVMIITQIPYLVEDNTAPSLAAVSIYIVCHFCKLQITKKQIADSCMISEVTISKCFKKIEPYISLLVPDKLNIIN